MPSAVSKKCTFFSKKQSFQNNYPNKTLVFVPETV